MEQLLPEQLPLLQPFFADSEETLLLSCMEGAFGEAWADNAQNPSCVKAIVADFTFFAGDADAPEAAALIAHCTPVQQARGFTLFVPSDERWSALIERVWNQHARRVTRYAIKKEPDVFDVEKLRRFVSALPEGYELRQIDAELYHRVMQTDWARDLCAAFQSADDFLTRGLGFVVLHQGELAAGCASYTSYSGGYEIEVDTRAHHRQKGLATVCAARFMLEALARGKYPSWDAQNPISVRLAEKLGYHFSHAYPTYEITPNNQQGE